MTISAVATRYANALADVVTGPNSTLQPQDALNELRSFESTLSASPELKNALHTPAVAASRKRAVTEKIGAILTLSKVTRNFLFVLIDRKRIDSLGEIIQSLELILDERAGIVRAEVATASALSEPQRATLTAELERLTGKRIRMQYAVDAALIGGVVARVGSTVYDGSVRGSLQTLERRLSAGN